MAYKLLGKNFTPPDVIAKVTGKAKYADDFHVDGWFLATDAVEKIQLVPDGQVTEQHQAGILAIDFSRVDSGVREEGRFAVVSQLRRRPGAFGRRHNHHDVALLEACSNQAQVELRRLFNELREPRYGFVIGGRGGQTRLFGRSDPGIVVRSYQALT